MEIKKKQIIAVLMITALALLFVASPLMSAGSFTTWISMSSGATNDLYGVWGPDSNHVFAVGKSGAILFFNGSAWRSMNSGNTSDLYSVWGTDNNHVFAVGKSGAILYFNGSAWSSMSSGNTSDLYGVWGSDGSHIYAVGGSGTILYYDGSAWSSITSGNSSDLYGIWGTDSNHVFAVGKAGAILYYDGSAWRSMNSGATNDLYGVWGTSGSNVFAVGSSGTVLKYDGLAWSSLTSGTAGNLHGIWGSDSSDIFVVGESGTITYYDGFRFTSMNRNTINDLRSVWGFSPADVFAAGGAGIIQRYLPPNINSISKIQGDQGEILDVIITGMNLTGATEVRFGSGIAVNNFTVVNSKQIKANITIVAGAVVGVRDISVSTQSGSYVLPAGFTVKQVLPTITSISPDQDRQGTTLTVTITGTDLTSVSDVRLGPGIAVNSFNVISSTQITANITIAADSETGLRDVSVTTSVGSIALPVSFTVKQTLPAIASISPAQGNQETSFAVTIDGTNLTRASEVTLGEGIVINKFTILNSNQIVANISIAYSAAVGTRDVSVTTPGGSVKLPNSFTVKQALPTITSISPDTGSQGATLYVTIIGTNLTGASQMRLGTGIAVNSFTILDSNRITAAITIVAGTETGARDVSVTTPGGSFALPNSFTVKQGLPVIISLSPENGSQGTSLAVIISGSNLDGTTSVSFGTGIAVQSFINLSPTQLRVNVLIDEEAVTGTRDVSLTTPGGSSTLGNRFNVNEKSLGVFFIALIWVGIAIVIGLFIFILNILRRQRTVNK